MVDKKQTKSYKRAQSTAGTRSIESEVTSDSQARNLLANQPKLTPKSKTPQKSLKTVRKEQKVIRLYGKKKAPREYTEKELDIPKLNMAVNPGVIVKKSGKKGKVFIADNDPLVYTRLIRQINDSRDSINESKLEKSRRLEEIRELRKQEMERKEQEKVDKIENKKAEIKNKANLARANRRKDNKGSAEAAKPKKRGVSFA
ncbi:hypothetical protein BABINDRAFT_63552 [Babjeviella inositovora NRRL Y-12698]|uniref:60S ribosomal subunit assembly/export protein LOC1 n=1 Tax=Babjeviella inositovora NRRL Y-12698 TaxID=984486 RepID=A0A1E3QPU0_9ASCO|nr:uncharacterized protein BABINDRAFT_63552 [Babjeviella inositovora NRRL Y-12698]ODQ78987.1 hypothetical protein BABINDRAFT_63552 [Babjeviella inositovora NRRL Y-12698]